MRAETAGSAFATAFLVLFVRHSRELADAMGQALRTLDAGFRVALTHYSPVAETLTGEPPEIYPFLGSYFLGEPASVAARPLVT